MSSILLSKIINMFSVFSPSRVLSECVLIEAVLDLEERIQSPVLALLQTIGDVIYSSPHRLPRALFPHLEHLRVREDALQVFFCNSGSLWFSLFLAQ